MAFPTTSIIDTFTRANENPLANGTWSGPCYPVSAGAQMQLLTNQGTAQNSTNDNDSYWSAATFGPDVEVWANIATFPGVNQATRFGARISSPNTGSVTGYVVVFNRRSGATDDVDFSSADMNTFNAIGATDSSVKWSGGLAVGISVVGTTISAFYKTSGGVWTLIATRANGSYGSAGNISWGGDNTTLRASGFGGGTVVVASGSAGSLVYDGYGIGSLVGGGLVT